MKDVIIPALLNNVSLDALGGPHLVLAILAKGKLRMIITNAVGEHRWVEVGVFNIVQDTTPTLSWRKDIGEYIRIAGARVIQCRDVKEFAEQVAANLL